MSYLVELRTHDTYIEADVRGERNHDTSAQDALKAIAIVAKKCKEKSLNKILINWYIKGKMDKGQSLILMSNLEKYNWSKSFKSASVHHDLLNFKSNTFTNIVAQNLGWNLKFFQQKDEALEWLLD